MNKFKNILLIFLSIFIFTGCDAIVGTTVNFSDLMNNEEKLLKGKLFIQVPSCSSYEDSRLESKNLKDVKSKILNMITDTTFKQCFTQKLISYAEFSVPIALTKNNNRSQKYIGIGSDSSNLLYVYIPKNLQEKIEKLQKQSIVKHDLRVQIELVNDLGMASPKFTALSVLIRDDPIVVSNNIWLKKGSKPVITLSDVSVKQALKYPYSLVLLRSK